MLIGYCSFSNKCMMTMSLLIASEEKNTSQIKLPYGKDINCLLDTFCLKNSGLKTENVKFKAER